MKLNPRKIAIIIALFNNEEDIERAISSAADQAVPDGFELEIIVVDDQSTDNGLKRAESIAAKHSNVRVLKTPENGGPAIARNLALAASDAAWFTPLDSDDALEPDRIANLIAFAEAHNADFVGDNLLITYGTSPFSVVRTLWPDKPDGPLALSPALFIRRSYGVSLDRSELGYLKPLINRNALRNPMQPYDPGLRFGEDFELYARLLLDGATGFLIDPCGYYFIQREASASRSQNGVDHLNLSRITRAFLNRDDLSEEDRAALMGHLRHSEKEAAHWALIDGVRNRSFKAFMNAFSISPSASVSALGFLASHPWRKLKPGEAREA